MKLPEAEVRSFQATLATCFAEHGRHDLPWRQTSDPYEIMVSELMLQQTQVRRVIPKYHEFLERFPTVESLAAAPLGDVLRVWQGLGYNRRAKFLWQAAQQIKGDFPDTQNALTALPGIGKNTAGAVLAYAFNKPAIFVETNVRTVYIHHFFNDQTSVDDKEILNLIEQTITDNPREFYWSLMDYGSHLKQTIGNKNVQSKQYAKQSPFQGSRRQIRGAILRALSARGYEKDELTAKIKDSRTTEVLRELAGEGFVTKSGSVYHLA
jgi:A/G-specific adenine glycosylase